MLELHLIDCIQRWRMLLLQIKPPRDRTMTNTVIREISMQDKGSWFTVYMQNHTWIPTTIKHKGPLTYLVQVAEGLIWKQHVNHLRETTDTPKDQTSLLVPTADSAEVELTDIQSLDVGASSTPRKSKESSTSDPVPEPATGI